MNRWIRKSIRLDIANTKRMIEAGAGDAILLQEKFELLKTFVILKAQIELKLLKKEKFVGGIEADENTKIFMGWLTGTSSTLN